MTLTLFTRNSRRSALSLFFVLALFLAACGGATPAADSGGGSPEVEATVTTESTAESGVPIAGGSGSGLCANDYYPVVEGASWVYVASGPTGDFNYTNTISNVRPDAFTLTSQFDELSVTYEWACTAEGLASLEFASGAEASLSTSGLSASYETTRSEGVTIPAHIAVGDTWTQVYDVVTTMTIAEGMNAAASGTVTQNFTAVGTESVTTAAGTFNAMKVEIHLVYDLQITLEGGTSMPMTLDSLTTTWWASGVGWVKSDQSVTIAGGEPISSTSDLQTYAIP